MGRAAGGVNGIGLAKGDHVASMEVVEPEGDLLVITARGYGKRTPLSDYPAKGTRDRRCGHHRSEGIETDRPDHGGTGGAGRG